MEEPTLWPRPVVRVMLVLLLLGWLLSAGVTDIGEISKVLGWEAGLLPLALAGEVGPG